MSGEAPPKPNCTICSRAAWGCHCMQYIEDREAVERNLRESCEIFKTKDSEKNVRIHELEAKNQDNEELLAKLAWFDSFNKQRIEDWRREHPLGANR